MPRKHPRPAARKLALKRARATAAHAEFAKRARPYIQNPRHGDGRKLALIAAALCLPGPIRSI